MNKSVRHNRLCVPAHVVWDRAKDIYIISRVGTIRWCQWVATIALYYPIPSEGNEPHATSATVPGESAMVKRLLGALRTGPSNHAMPRALRPQPPRDGTVDRFMHYMSTTCHPHTRAALISSAGHCPARLSAVQWSQTHSGSFQTLGPESWPHANRLQAS